MGKHFMRIYEAKLPGNTAVRKGTWAKLPTEAWMKVQLCKKFDAWIALEVAAERTDQPGQLERDDEIARIRWAKCKRVI